MVWNYRGFRSLAVLVTALAVGSAPALGSKEPQRPASPLTRDRRLLKPAIRPGLETASNATPSEPLQTTAGELVDELSRTVRAPLAIQRNLRVRRLCISSRAMSCAEVMQALQGCLGGTWVPVREAWVLTEFPDLAAHVLLPWAVAGEQGGSFNAALRRLTSTQVGVLRARGTLASTELTSEQRTALLAIIRTKYMNSLQDDVAPEALQLEGVRLATEKGDRSVPPGEIALILPTASSASSRALMSIELTTLQEPLPAGIDPRIPEANVRAAGMLPWAAPRRTESQEAQFRGDTRLDSLVASHAGEKRLPVWVTMGAAAQAAGVDLLAGTQLDQREIPAWKDQTAARELLLAVEAATGGRWIPVAQGYVLQPDRRIERSARIDPPRQEQWVQRTFAAAVGRLSAQARETLLKGGATSPSSLGNTERGYLRDVGAAVFGVRAEVPYDAVELKGVTLTILPEDKARKVPRRLKYVPAPEMSPNQERRPPITAPF